MKNDPHNERKEREEILKMRSTRSRDWFPDLAKFILDAHGYSFREWFVSLGTGPEATQRIAYLETREAIDERFVILKQTTGESIFLRELLGRIANGYDVREMLNIKPRKIGHRPRDPLGPVIASEIRARIKEGDRVSVAIREVAAIVRKGEEAVRLVYRRQRRQDKR
jgi:hypothetical protein